MAVCDLKVAKAAVDQAFERGKEAERARILAIIERREWIVIDDLGIEESPTVAKLKSLIESQP